MEAHGEAGPTPASPLQQPTMLRPPKALLVTRHAGEEDPLRDLLEQDGWAVETCAGAVPGKCPLMRGEHCPLRHSSDATIVFLDPHELFPGMSTLPRLRCAEAGASPRVVALENSAGQAHFKGSNATVGAARGPEPVLSAMYALLAAKR